MFSVTKYFHVLTRGFYLQVVCGGYVLEIGARNYRNKYHKESSGHCCELYQTSNCDPWWCTHCHCDNRFRFCLRYLQTRRDGNTGNCPLGGYSTRYVGGDSFTFSNWIPSTYRHIPNPMRFTGGVWPVSKSASVKWLGFLEMAFVQ